MDPYIFPWSTKKINRQKTKPLKGKDKNKKIKRTKKGHIHAYIHAYLHRKNNISIHMHIHTHTHTHIPAYSYTYTNNMSHIHTHSIYIICYMICDIYINYLYLLLIIYYDLLLLVPGWKPDGPIRSLLSVRPSVCIKTAQNRLLC